MATIEKHFFEDNETNAILLMKVKSVYVPKILMLEEIRKSFV